MSKPSDPYRKGFSASARRLRRAGLQAADSAQKPIDANEYVTAIEDAFEHMGGQLNPFGQSTLYLDPEDQEMVDFESNFMVCAICGVPLNHLTDYDGTSTWVHSRTWRAYDHEPEPIRSERKLVDEAVCDFCGTETRMYAAYAGQRIRQDQGSATHDYGTTWSACQKCMHFIDDGDFDGLLAHGVRVSPTLSGLGRTIRQEMIANWKALWSAFLPTIHTREYIGPQRAPAKLNPRMMPKLRDGLIKFWKHAGPAIRVTDRRPTGMTMSFPGVHAGSEDDFLIRYQAEDPIPRSVWDNHAGHIVAGLHASQLFWISADFTQLSILAGKDFDKVTLTREQLPAPFGFLVYDQPIGEIPRPGGQAAIRAVSWTLVPQGVWLNLYIQGEDSAPEIDVEAMRSEFGYLLCPNAGGGFRFNDLLDFFKAPEGISTDFIATIFATWFLMAQPGVAEQRPAPVDKKAERAYKRANANRTPPAVQLVDLRRRPRRPDGPEGHEGRKLAFRVYRRGHWKRQFYGPGRAMRKTIYVSAYIAGPEGAPLHDKPTKVNILR